MARGFKKISLEQFKKDISNDETLYKNYILPTRGTKVSAGYDFYTIEDITIEPGEYKKLPSGIKAYMNDNEVLFIIVRSSTGIKKNIRMRNQVGVVDSDYYNNESNEGHIFFPLQNEGKEPIIIPAGERIVQGIFLNYLITETDNYIYENRLGGIGSTTKGDD